MPFEVVPGVTAGVAAPGVRGNPGHPPRRRVRGGVRHRARGPRQGRVFPRLGCPRRVPGHAGPVHGRQAAAGDHGAADRSRARRHRAGGRRRARNDERSADGERLARRAPGRGGGRRDCDRRRSSWSAQSRRAATRSRGSRTARCTDAGSSSRVLGPRRAGSRGRLIALGAEVVELPAIRIEPRIDSDAVRRAVDDIYSYALVCLTSPNGADLLFEAMAAAGRDARALANATVAAIGPGTASALHQPRRDRRRRPGGVGGRGAGRGAGRRRRRGTAGARRARR